MHQSFPFNFLFHLGPKYYIIHFFLTMSRDEYAHCTLFKISEKNKWILLTVISIINFQVARLQLEVKVLLSFRTITILYIIICRSISFLRVNIIIYTIWISGLDCAVYSIEKMHIHYEVPFTVGNMPPMYDSSLRNQFWKTLMKCTPNNRNINSTLSDLLTLYKNLIVLHTRTIIR